MTPHAWSILSLSLLTIMAAAAVAPALATVQAAFPDVSPTTIKMLLTVPSLCIIPLSFLSAKLCAILGTRRTIFLGASLYLLGGMGGGLAPNFSMLMATRVILGIGVGILMPMSNSLVSVFFQGEERVKMMGRTASTANLGGVFALICSGLLAQISWRHSFAIYGIALVTVTLVALFLKEPPRSASPSSAEGRLPLGAKLGALGLMLLMIVFYCLPTNLAMFLVAEQYGSASSAGMALAFATGTGFFAGLLLPRTRKVCGSYLGPAMLSCMALGFAMLNYATGFLQAKCGVILVGLGFGTLWPSLLVLIAQATPLPLSMRAMALGGSMIFLGQFLSPLIFDLAGTLMGAMHPRMAFGLASLAAAVAVPCLLAGKGRLLRVMALPKEA